MHESEVGALGDGDSIARQAFGLIELSCGRCTTRSRGPPQHLRSKVIRGGVLLANDAQASGLVVAAEVAADPGRMAGERLENAPLAELLEHEAPALELLHGSVDVSRQLFD
jgi:hypothetical protein